MSFPLTAFSYMARGFARDVVAFLVCLLVIVYLFEVMELLRRSAGQADVSWLLILQMGALKLPDMGQILLPFAILLAAMFTLWRLGVRSEITILRAAGLSVGQIVAPFMVVALAAATLQIGLINPLGAVFLGKFKEMEAVHLEGQAQSQIAVFAKGLWLHQPLPQGRYVILHAAKIAQGCAALEGITVLYFDSHDAQTLRIDASKGALKEGAWVFEDVVAHTPQSPFATKLARHTLATTLTPTQIARSFAAPESMSFWALPSYIRVLEETGFDARVLRAAYHRLLAQPFMFLAVIAFAAVLFLRLPRGRGVVLRVGAGLAIGFGLFFFARFLEALGTSGQIPIILAAWSPSVVALLLSVAALLHWEEGGQ